jgi:hypothetical protein
MSQRQKNWHTNGLNITCFPKRKEQENIRYSHRGKSFIALFDHPEDAWKVITAIRKVDSSDVILANLAAGPLEDLLAKHGEQFIDQVERLARRDEEFRYILTGVWGQNRMRKEVWDRLCAITEKAKSSL